MTAKEFLHSTHLTLTEWDVTTLVNLARSQGYTFTSEELETAADELWGNLNEEQLRDVAGGGGNGRTTTGPVTPDKSNMAGKATGDAWTPPPGDVSGNSCFFIRG